MSRLFHREAKLTVAKPLAGSFSDTEPNGLEITGLRIQFSIEKSTNSSANTAEIIVSNVSETTRVFLEKKPLYVRLDVGHDGELARLFTGDLRFARTLRESADKETLLQLGDGDRAIRYGRVNRSYRSGIDAATVVKEAAKGLGYPKVNLSAGAALDLRAQYVGGAALHGNASKELSRLLSPFGLTWSIQDGRLQILRPDEWRSDQAIRIAQDEGMIGEPVLGPPAKKGGKPVLTVRTLVKPELTPGGRISLDSQRIRGIFRIDRVSHTGDTRGEEWYSTIEAKLV